MIHQSCAKLGTVCCPFDHVTENVDDYSKTHDNPDFGRIPTFEEEDSSYRINPPPSISNYEQFIKTYPNVKVKQGPDGKLYIQPNPELSEHDDVHYSTPKGHDFLPKPYKCGQSSFNHLNRRLVNTDTNSAAKKHEFPWQVKIGIKKINAISYNMIFLLGSYFVKSKNLSVQRRRVLSRRIPSGYRG